MKKFGYIFMTSLIIIVVIFFRISKSVDDFIGFKNLFDLKESKLIGKWNVDELYYTFYDNEELVESSNLSNTEILIFNKDYSGVTIMVDESDTIFFNWKLRNNILTMYDLNIVEIDELEPIFRLKRNGKNKLISRGGFSIKEGTSIIVERHLTKIEL